MTSRISLVFLGLVGVVASGYLNGGSGYSVLTNHYGNYLGQGLGGKYYEPKQYEPISYPKYSFDYGVKDAHTGDQKSQWEKRDGDVVKGGYTLKEADGTTRIVEYAADGHSGFNAVVKNIGHAYHPQVYKKESYGHSASLYNSGGYGGNLGGYSGGLGHGLATSYVNINQHI